ncbi:Alpha/Beta hydrolase protein [Cokeromyces recurvatus]|uniref:Alpha/Beta hydrolase protein n=1 Tax=Cokeromyces recurvatus TaxID=90255 RepID=UPI002220D546|nr:Alpha/Beta hydrolase protein [Cokeromyces recurvatus]KAI7897664.1 Alpha/Beta hydrolase protein [Cokeromyces recurvatus]
MVTTAAKFTPSDLIQLPRPSASVISPNGTLAVYAQSVYDISEAKSTRHLYLLNVEDNTIEELTKPSFDTSDSEPFFLDDSHIAYFHHNDEEVDQLYVLNLDNRQEPSYRLTNFPISFGNVKYNVKHQLLAFSASVYNDEGTLEGTFEKDKQLKETKKDTALVFDELMVRHWDDYVKEKKNNIFVVHLEVIEDKYQLKDKPVNLLRKTGLESPGFPLGDASDFDISPDASQLAFVAKINTKDNAWQTSAHIYTVSTSGLDEPVAINKDIPAASSNPHYTSSNLLVYFQMLTPQYEADRNRIVIYDPETKSRKVIAKDWDSSPHEVTSSLDSKTLYLTAEQEGRNKIFAIDIETESIETLTNDKYATKLQVLPSGNIFYSLSSVKHPVLPHLLDISTKEVKRFNAEPNLLEKLKSIDFSEPEEFRFTGALNEQVHGWHLKPAQFEEGKKYPVAFLIHGGPQGAWNDNWSTRWNPQVFAGAGYGVIAINFHGSTGYGQAFTDSIGNHWGSYPYYDLETGLDYVLKKYSYLDAERVAGLGASYGGYMINWLNGHSDKFKAFVNHDGVFSTTQVYFTTDEIYFPEKEYAGNPIDPKGRNNYEKYSPANFVQHWKTPTLVIHGGRDFRLTFGESLSTFTALQRQGIPSRLVYFPDENHWVLKPANSLRWHKEVLEWINTYTTVKNESQVMTPTFHLQE